MDNLDQDLDGLPILKKTNVSSPDIVSNDIDGLPILKKKVGTLESSPSGLPLPSQKDILNLTEFAEKLKKTPGSSAPKKITGLSDKNVPSTEGLVVPTNLPKQDVMAYESQLKTNDAAINTLTDIYNKKGLKFDPSKPAAKAQIQEYIDKEKNNDLVRVSGKDGKEYLTRAAGFWETGARTLAKSLYDPIESTEINLTNNPSDLANLLDDKASREANYPEQAPSKVAGYYGGLAGGLPKMMALLSIPYVGEAAMVTDMYHNAMANQRRELYERGIRSVEDGGEGLDRETAAKMAMQTAPTAAIPDAVMGTILARTGAINKLAGGGVAEGVGKEILPAAAKKSFIDAASTFGKEVGIMGGLGFGSGIGRGLIKKEAGYNVTPEELGKDALSEAGEYALMHSAFKLVHVAPKAIAAAAKNLLSHVPEPILKVEAENHPDGEQTLKEVADFSNTKTKVADFVPEEKVGSVTGLTEKIDNLKKDVADLEQKKEGVPASVAEQIDSQINDKNKEIDFYNNQIKKVIDSKDETGIGEEIDEVTGRKLGGFEPIVEVLERPTQEQQFKESSEGNTVTFTYKSEAEVPDVFKDRISSSGENTLSDGTVEKFVRVTVPKSLAEYELNKTKPAEKVKPTEEEVFSETDKNGREITYFSNTTESNGSVKTKFTFSRSDKNSSERFASKQGVPVKEALGDKFTINEEDILNGAKVVKVSEVRVDKDGNAAATVTFELDGETYEGEVRLNENKPKTEVKPTEEIVSTENGKFKSSQGHTVEFENGKLIVKDKKGEVLSDRASKKAIEEYADKFDYEKGKKVLEVPDEITNSRDAAKYVIDESSNPAQIAEVYSSEDLVPKESNAKFQAIAEHGLGRIKTSSYKMFGDVNNIEKSMYLKIFSQEKGLPIDVVAKSISDKYEGLNIEPKDIVDYIEKYSKGDKAVLEFEESDIARQARNKFNELTGLDLNPELANKILDKQLEKANKDQLDIIKEDYETAKQLEDAYWAAEKETDGFTKESPVSKVNEPKEASKENVVEEPDGSTTSIKNKVTAEERAEKGLSEIEVTAKRTFGDVFEKGKKMVEENKIDPRQMARDLADKPRALSPEESVALLYDRMRIQNEFKKLSADIEKEPDGIIKDMMLSKLKQLEQDALINDEASRKTGYEQGLGLAVRKMIIKEDYSLLNQLNKYKAANNGEELSPEIRKKLEENVAKLEIAEKKLEEYEQKIKDLQAKKTIDTEAKKTKKVNKTTEDFKKEREDIFKNIKDKWDSASKSDIVTAVPLPYSAQLAAISPEVLKLVKSYAEQGITKLDDIVNDLHDNLSKQIPQITKRDVKDILAGEYSQVKEKKVPVVDREKMRLEADINRIKNQINLEKQEIERSKRSKLQKGVDYFQKWRRFALLSGIPVLGKIGLSGTLRSAVTTPIESFIGKGLSKIPGISRIAAGAPREGSSSIKAESKAFAQFVDKATFQDIRQVLKTGRGELEELHDKKLYPSDGWLDFFGQLHAAIKVLPKRAEYFRSLEIRTEDALKNGKDITDPVVQQDISAAAYSDALRAIYMQENYVTELYKNSIRFLESAKGGKGKPIAEMLKFILPIIKVPTNYVAEESSYILGGVKALYALRKGISKLSAEDKDYVMRALKKQSIGAAFLALGYANPQAVGGYYTGKRKKGDLEAGDLVVYGVHMPHWALHTPLLEALQFGASIRRSRDAAGRGSKRKDLNILTGVLPAASAVARQVPFSQQAEQLSRIKNTDAFLNYVSGQAQSVIEPQLIKNIAEFTDYSNGKWNKRQAKTFEEKLKAGFPGMREDLKLKK